MYQTGMWWLHNFWSSSQSLSRLTVAEQLEGRLARLWPPYSLQSGRLGET